MNPAFVSGDDNNEIFNIISRCYLPSISDYISYRMEAQECPHDSDGAMFYVPAHAGFGKQPLYRLFNITHLDHMDSNSQSEGREYGYYYQDTLGYSYSSQIHGTCPINRLRGLNDHATVFCGEQIAGCTYEYNLGYGFIRYPKTSYVHIDIDADIVPLSIKGQSISLYADLAAGGQIAGLYWNNKQFVNNWDYGRQIQISLNITDIIEAGDPSEVTEGGDIYSNPIYRTKFIAHGSPVISYAVSGKTLSTSAYSLRWIPEDHGGNSFNPVCWKGVISKEITLDFNGWSDVMQWKTIVNFPTSGRYWVDMAIPGAYLKPEFSKLFTYDLSRNLFKEQSIDADMCTSGSSGCKEYQIYPAGAVIVSTDDDSYALGIYRRYVSTEPPDALLPNSFGLCNCLNNPIPTTKAIALQRQAVNNAGEYVYTVYLVVGTLQSVVNRVQELYASNF